MLKSAKKKNVCYFVYLLFTAVFLFTGCDNMFHKPVKSWFEKYTDTAAIELQELDGEYPQNAKGITCIPSGDSHTVTFYLRNPQNYKLDTRFIKGIDDPYDNTQVIIEQDQDDRAIIRMRYKGDFLKSKDQETDPEAKSLSGRVTLVESESERSFEEWPVELSANSVPLPVKSPAFQVDGSDYSTANYWVCFFMPEYSTVEDSIHKDTKYLIVNGTRKYIKNDTIYTDEECTTVDGDFTTTKPSGLGNLSQLNENSNGVDFDFDETKCPDGYQVMYYNTKHHPSTDTYNVSFTAEDTEGLSSSISISNKAKQLVEPVFNVESDHTYDADETSFLYKVTISHPFTCTDDTSCGKGVTINYTITEENGTPVFADGTSSKLSGKATDKVTINLPKGKYIITADAVKNYYIASEKTEVSGVRVLKRAIYYISQTGIDAESTAGSSADPYRTIQYAVNKFFADVDSGEYVSATNCRIYVMTNLTAPDDFNWEESEDAFVNISPSSSYTGKITIKGSGGKRTIDLENNGKSGIIIAGGNVEIDSINLTNISSDTDSVYTIYTAGGNIIYSNGSVNNCKGINHGNVYVYDVGKFTMSNVSFSESGSDTGNALGAIKINAGEVECKNCTFTKLTSLSGAGAIENKGTLTLTDCKFTNCSSNSHGGAIINDGGALTLTGVTIDGCKAGGDASWAKNQGGAIWNSDAHFITLENVVIKNCTFNEEVYEHSTNLPLGAAIYSEDDIELKGKNTIINNKLPNGTASNVYLKTGCILKITGDITGSRIGINVPWTAGATDAPSVGTPVAFTDGYGYPETNSSKPGVIFTAENGYGITPITSESGAGEAAFAVSSGAMYTALDYNFSFALKDVLGNTAHGFMPGKGASYTIVPTINRKETGSAEPTTLHYKAADKELYVNYNESTGVYSSPAAEGNKVTWTAALMNGSYKVADLTVSSTAAGGVKVSVPDTVNREDTYTIKLSVKYLGITHDASFSLVCDYSAENAASYIASLTTAGTYDVKVTGAVGSGINKTTTEITSTDEGLAKVAKAIRAKNGTGVKIKLNAAETSMGSSISTYNSGQYFKNCENLLSITLPDWMEYVIPNLFSGCTNLTSVTLSPNTQLICENAFKDCSKLASITIPAGIAGSDATHGIQTGAFTGCKSGFKIIYQGTKNQWSKVKRSDQAVAATKWHDGDFEEGDTAGSVTCTNGKCGFDYTIIPSVADLTSAPTSGTYVLSTVDELKKIRDWVNTTPHSTLENVTFKLTGDIDTEGEQIIIGHYEYSSDNYAFSGTFDGNGHKITNTIAETDSSNKSTALFYYVNNGNIKNLTVAGTSNRSSIVGYLKNGTVENCISETTITVSSTDSVSDLIIGGIVAYADRVSSGSNIIKNCINKGDITVEVNSNTVAGGIIGEFWNYTGQIDRCINKGNITIKKVSALGGIVAKLAEYKSISNCKNIGTITNTDGSSYVGGIAGAINNGNEAKETEDMILNCCNLGVVNSSGSTGSGLLGYFPKKPHIKNNCNSGSSYYGFASNIDRTGTFRLTSVDWINDNYCMEGSYRSGKIVNYSGSIEFTESNVKTFTSSQADDIIASLNNWATTNSTDSLQFASWNKNAEGKPELDFGELEDK